MINGTVSLPGRGNTAYAVALRGRVQKAIAAAPLRGIWSKASIFVCLKGETDMERFKKVSYALDAIMSASSVNHRVRKSVPEREVTPECTTGWLHKTRERAERERWHEDVKHMMNHVIR